MVNDSLSTLQVELSNNNSHYFRKFSSREIDLFSHYYLGVLKWNELLHLTTIINPVDFIARHIMESAFAAQNISSGISEAWDIGSGAGIPGIPIAILRPDLNVILIESNRKKAIFLKEIASELHLSNVYVLNQPFELLDKPGAGSLVITRALDSLSELVPAILNFSENASQTVFFGNDSLLKQIEHLVKQDQSVNIIRPPQSTRTFLISISCFT